jgi:hypothetical protein
MDSALDKQLCEKYPKIFRDRHASKMKTLMCWGFDHDDGWYDILDTLCYNVQNHIDWTRSNRAKALKLNRKIKKAIEQNSIDPIKDVYTGEWWIERCKKIVREKKYEPVPKAARQLIAVQVKEKFGTLRFYYEGGDEVTEGMVRIAESMSARTCEVCGDRGKLRNEGWVRSLCSKHAEEMGYT